jgi:hypothetical protein
MIEQSRHLPRQQSGSDMRDKGAEICCREEQPANADAPKSAANQRRSKETIEHPRQWENILTQNLSESYVDEGIDIDCGESKPPNAFAPKNEMRELASKMR